jgi:TM2 domain-containing membrane protein YozV
MPKVWRQAKPVPTPTPVAPIPSIIGHTAPSGRNRLTAALFAIILGGLGVHKFYLGNIREGIVYLLLCWTFLPAIIGFVEGIIYLTMSDAAFEQKYGDKTPAV